MFGQPFVLRQLGASGLFSNPAALDVFVSLLALFGVGALVYAGWVLAKAPGAFPRVHLKPSHRRKKHRKEKNGRAER